MIQTWKAWVSLGALNGFCATAAGAYAQHGLNAPEPVLEKAFATGVEYQMWHALALLAVAWLAERAESAGHNPWLARSAGLAFVLGIAAAAGAIGQSRVAAAACEGAARNPGASGKIQVMMILGLALIESLVLFALLVVFAGIK